MWTLPSCLRCFDLLIDPLSLFTHASLPFVLPNKDLRAFTPFAALQGPLMVGLPPRIADHIDVPTLKIATKCIFIMRASWQNPLH